MVLVSRIGDPSSVRDSTVVESGIERYESISVPVVSSERFFIRRSRIRLEVVINVIDFSLLSCKKFGSQNYFRIREYGRRYFGRERYPVLDVPNLRSPVEKRNHLDSQYHLRIIDVRHPNSRDSFIRGVARIRLY